MRKKRKNIKFSSSDRIYLMKRLAFLSGAGMPLEKSLLLIADQEKQPKRRGIFEHLAAEVSAGKYLSESLRHFKRAFSNFSICIIKAGEESGLLAKNLTHISRELEKHASLKKKIIGILIYPCVVAVGTFGLTAFLTLYIFPKIQPLFASFKTTLPWSTRLMLFATRFVGHYWLGIFSGIVICTTTLISIWYKSQTCKIATEYLILHLPLVGPIIRTYALTTVFRQLGLMLEAGTPADKALDITAHTAPLIIYKHIFLEMSHKVAQGEQISLSAKRHSFLIPHDASRLLAVAETTGKLAETLIYLATAYNEEIEMNIKNFSSLIEPIMMVLMGIIVGFVSISIITPIYAITQNIK